MSEPFALVDRPAPPPHLDIAIPLADLAWTAHRSMRHYQPTPHHQLDDLARELGVASLIVKDESPRFGLNAFKGLGASFAMRHWLATRTVEPGAVFTTATDGNHGRAVAWMSRMLGYRSVVFMPAHSVRARVAAIENEGARVVLVEEGYDEAVRLALLAATEKGWIAIQDTATPEYTEVPAWIAAGYQTSARELEGDVFTPEIPAVDVVFLHAGVGTWPASMTGYLWHRYGERRPRVAVVEPAEAACVLDSVRAGHVVRARGSLRTIMAGLNCALPSTAAFEVLRNSVDAFIEIADSWAERAMRRLADCDPPIVAGESGAASVAGLMAVMRDAAFSPVRERLSLGRNSRVLVWNTEGATDPAGWERVVGRPVPG